MGSPVAAAPTATLPAILAVAARAHGDRPYAFDAGGRDRATYEQMYARSLRWATAFERAGVRAGETVLTMAPNSVEALSIWIGLSWLRAIEVPVNNELRGSVLGHVVRTSGAALVVVAEHLLPALATAPEAQQLRAVVAPTSEASGGSGTWPTGAQSVDDFLRPPEETLLRREAPQGHDIACVLFTSGTTGRSKGVAIPWHNLYTSAVGSLPIDDLSDADCWYGPGSASHVGAKSMPLLFALIGGRIVLRERFSTSAFWPDVNAFGVTSTVMVSTLAHYLHGQPRRAEDAATSLRNVLMVPVIPQLDDFNRRFGTRVCTVFNMTELSVPISSGWQISDWRSCGRLRTGRPGYEVRLVDDDDLPVATGQVGQLVVRADEPWCMGQGYVGDAAATAASWRNGWFHTGDLLRMDDSGAFYFVDRLKDSIRVRGENVSSFEVEAEVSAYPGVAECAAVAVPSTNGEDDIKVFVVAVPGAVLDPEQLIDFLRPRVARFMLPRYLEVIDELPKNWRLRVRKDLLRDHPRSAEWDRHAGTTSTASALADVDTNR